MAIFWKKSENEQSIIYQSKIKRTGFIGIIIFLLISLVFATLIPNMLVRALAGALIFLILIFSVVVCFDNLPILRDQNRAIKAGKKVFFSRQNGLDEVTIEK